MRRIVVLLVLAVPLALLAPAAAAQQDVMLHVYPKDGVFHYAPARVPIEPNGTVVLGHLFGTHSLTSVDGLFNATGNASHWPSLRAPATPGTYRFYCWLHADAGTPLGQGMVGELVVAAARPPAPPTARDAPAGGALLALAVAAVLAALRRA